MRATYLVIFLSTCCVISGEGARLAILLNALHLHASPLLVGVLGSLFSALPALSSVAIGRWVDRIGTRVPMLLSSALMSAGCALAFLWRELATLFVVSIVVGTFANVFIVATLQMLGRDGRPGSRMRNFSILTTSNSLAMFVAPLLVGFGIDRAGFATTFLLLACFSLVSALIIGCGLVPGLGAPRTSHGERGASAASVSPSTDSGRKPTGRAIDLLHIPALRRAYGIAFATSTSILLFMFVVPLFGVQRALTASWIGTLLAAFSLTMAGVRILTPILTRALAPWRLIIGTLSASGVLLLLVPFLDHALVLLAISAFLGASLGLSSPIILSLLAEASPPERVGEVLGLRLTMVNMIMTGVPLVAGSVGAALGIAPVFWLISLLLLGGCYMARRQWHAVPSHRAG